MMRRTITALATLAAATLAVAPAMAQTKLKWAHVYETSEPFHTASVWAAGEIAKRTNGRYTDRRLSRASQLGKETDINQGLSLGSVDIIISGSSFAAKSYPADRRDLLSRTPSAMRTICSPTPRATSSRN